MKKVAVFADSNATQPEHLRKLQEQAHSRGVEVLVRSLVKKDDVISAIREVKASDAEAINFLATPMFSLNNADVIEEVTTSRLPSIYQWPEDAEGGALLAYGPRFAEIFRERARMVVKILRGTKAADIPIEQPTKFELVINLKTAKAIGADVSASLVARADKLIEQDASCCGARVRFWHKADIARTPRRATSPLRTHYRCRLSFASARTAFSASVLKLSNVQSNGTRRPRRFSGSSSHLSITIDRFLRGSRFKPSILNVAIKGSIRGARHLTIFSSGLTHLRWDARDRLCS